MSYGRFILCCFVLLQPATLLAEGNDTTEARRPNIILILADDLGYGDLGCYGQQAIQTPNIDRLAREGLRFTDFHAGSTVCAPSRCVLMTGYHTGHALIRGNAKDNLRPDDVTLPEVLKPAGYTTALIGKWGLGHEGSTGVPTLQGFDYFYGYLDQHHAHNYYPAFLHRNTERVALRNVVPGDGDFGSGVATSKLDYSHDLLAEEALQFVRDHHQQPFFLYLAFTIPHANNEAGKLGMEVPDLAPYTDQDWPAAEKGYAAMISRMDKDVGRLLDLLKQLDIDDETLVMFSSDNGPHREGGHDPEFHDSNGPLRGIKRDLTEGGIRVPLIARWPGTIAANTTSDWVGYFADLLPTCAELAGCAEHVPDGLDGISFAPTLRGQSQDQKDHEYLYWAFYERGGGQAVRAGTWKAIEQPLHSPLRLYNLASDIGESTDLAEEQPEIAARLRGYMQEAYVPSDKWKFPRQ